MKTVLILKIPERVQEFTGDVHGSDFENCWFREILAQVHKGKSKKVYFSIICGCKELVGPICPILEEWRSKMWRMNVRSDKLDVHITIWRDLKKKKKK